MSTDLYGIRVVDTKPEENKVVIKVFVVYYDVAYKNHQPLPKDPSFFFRILWDEGDTRFGKGGTIGNEVSVDQICDEPWVDNNTFRFIKNVKQLRTTNFPLTDYTGYADFYYERNGSWENEDKLVQATYEIEVTDTKYFDHLSSGMSWGTTAYQTKAVKVSHAYLSSLPDITKPLTQLHPFKDKSICDVLFSQDNAYFFALSSSGELVCYCMDSWEIVWRRDTQLTSPEKIECDNTQKLIWAQDSGQPTDKVIFNFAGEIEQENIWPDTAGVSLNSAYRSPSGNYFLLHPQDMEDITIHDAKGKFLWTYPDFNGEEWRHAFFPKEEKLLVVVLSLDILKVFDLQTGKELRTTDYEEVYEGYCWSIDPTGQFFSCNDAQFRKSEVIYTTKIVELERMKTILEYGTKPSNRDYLEPCTWSPNNQLVAIITRNKRNNEFEGYVTIYPIGIDSMERCRKISNG